MNFEWTPRKAEINLRKHGISFTEAGTVFGDDLAITLSPTLIIRLMKIVTSQLDGQIATDC